jgi:TolB-like protein/Tfp pilus assembly protein PilF/tRNA A-37 threonylcarbamoyl transferase component Bud32
MNKSVNTSDFVPDEIETVAKCPRCGATTRLNHGTCINCFLREGLETKGEPSRETFESTLVEANVTDTQWRLGHYEILEEIGRGGMGVIYRARQQHSRRIVAVKRILAHDVNSHETLVRFRREAEAVASLDHPNILPIHEVSESEEGLPFFSMKYATGGSLRTAAPALRDKPRKSVQLMTKVARAIAYAHSKGVLHRDLQPGNILLDENDEPMVSDFGLAKWLDQTSDLTRTLETLGTPGYIAPEQTECRAAADLTSAADIYSLGAILFYLLTGRPPFIGPNVLSVIHQAAAAPSPRLRSLVPSLNRDLETIVGRCLESHPGARYQSAGALADDLERWLQHEPIRARRSGIFTRGRKWVRRNPTSTVLVALLVALGTVIGVMLWEKESARPSPPIATSDKSIAVLPFENLSEDKANAYLAVGIQDEILTRLAKIGALKVIARTSTQSYESKPGNLGEIAKQLGVANILEGSIQKSADRVHINLQLIRAATGEHLWAETYDRKSDNIFDLQGEVAAAVAEALQAKLTGAEQAALRQTPTNNADAYDAYLRGIVYSERPGWDVQNVWEAIRSFRKAVTLDPAFALAWARLALIAGLGCLNQYAEEGGDFHRTCEEVKRAADKAMSLQPDLAESNLAQGAWYKYGERNYDAAIPWVEKAHQLSPNSSLALQGLAAIYRSKGDCKRSLEYYGRALELDPRNTHLREVQGRMLATVRHYPEALKNYDKILDMLPSDPSGDFALACKAHINQCQGDLQVAAALLRSHQPVQRSGEGVFDVQIIQWLYERRYSDGIAALTQALQRPDLAAGGNFWVPSQIEGNLAWFLELSGDSKAARSRWENVRSKGEELRKQGHFSVHLRWLATANLALGDKDKAFAIAREMAASESIDAMVTVNIERMICEFTLQSGDKESALAQLAHLVALPYGSYSMPFGVSLVGVSYGDLKFNPLWDSLRGDPRFEKLVEEVKRPVALESPPPMPGGIAVLPFENLSADPDNAFFTDGVQDEILNNLAKIADLKVISRTSVMQYKSGAKRNLRQIADELGVAHVVEGSVQRDANRVRVSAQLIDAKTDTHLWADNYDRPLGDVFAIQSEIAKAIAAQLQAKLSPAEKAAIEQPPTTNLVAYDRYVRARKLRAVPTARVPGDMPEIIRLLDQAVAHDPTFLRAYCALASAHAYVYHLGIDHTPARVALAKAALDTALRLGANHGETHLAAAWVAYHCYRDYETALKEGALARRGLPNDASVFSLPAYIARRQGHWEECARNLERAAELDPHNVWLLNDVAQTYQGDRRFSEAKVAWDRVLGVAPDDPTMRVARTLLDLESRADTQPAHEAIQHIVTEDPSAVDAIAEQCLYVALCRRDATEMASALASLPPEGIIPWNVRMPRSFFEGLVARVRNDATGAETAFTAARVEMEKIVREQPDYAQAFCVLGMIDAALGHKKDAIREGRRAVELLPVTKDALAGAAVLTNLAITYAWAGEKDLAIKQLDELVQIPSPACYGQLKLHPFWDPLRGDPRFEKLVEESKKPVALNHEL